MMTMRQGVYPRVCGGAAYENNSTARAEGLSPRVRGSRPTRHESALGRGSIPACAGEPAQCRTRPGGHGVYPRVCGGACLIVVGMAQWMGLSPRVRGSLMAFALLFGIIGSIPACAGEPNCKTRVSLKIWVYPRVCGGASTPQWLAGSDTGLSPRVRGSLENIPRRPALRGSIPACAGEPQSNL